MSCSAPWAAATPCLQRAGRRTGRGSAFEQLYYYPQYSELAFAVSAAPPQLGQLTLHLDDVQVQLSGAQSERYFYWTVAVKLTRTDPDAVAVAGPGLSVADTQGSRGRGGGAFLPGAWSLPAKEQPSQSPTP